MTAAAGAMIEVPVPPEVTPEMLGQRLIARAAIGPADLERALDLQGEVGGRLGNLLIRTGALSEEQLLAALSEQLGLPLAGHDVLLPEIETWVVPGEDPVSVDWMQDQDVLLWQDPEGQVWCASRDPLDPTLQEALAYVYPGVSVRSALATAQLMEGTLDRLARGLVAAGHGGDDVRHLRELAEEAPIIELVNNILSQAVEAKASDIHIEAGESLFVVRIRVDGVLHQRMTQPMDRFAAVASRIKLISGADIAERRLPQDGRMSTRVSGREFDMRVSTRPDVHGESIVLRLLPKERADLDLERLGMEPDHLALMGEWAARRTASSW